VTEIRTKPLDEITWDDITALAASGTAEDAMLEFKGLLPEKNGKQHPWYGDRDVMTDFTRDELAAEVVALANAYGGRLIIGIAETQDRPRRAAGPAPLPRCGKFAEQFEQALRSLIDPPIGGLLVKAIVDPGTEDTGAVMIAVPASDLAPHGIGRPPLAYVRRGTSCEPMTMRDLQSVFWDARTRRERLDAIRARERAALAAKLGPNLTVGLHAENSVSFPAELFVRFTAITHQPLDLTHGDLGSILPRSRLAASAFGQDWRLPFGGGQPSEGWAPRAQGYQAVDEGPSDWTVLQDGTISVIGTSSGESRARLAQLHFPQEFTRQAAQVVVMADWLRREAGRPDVPIEIDVEMLHHGDASAFDGRRLGHLNASVEIGPVMLTSRASAENTFRELEQQIWNGFGLIHIDRARVDFAKWFRREP